MPHIFKESCYEKAIAIGKAKVGDTVYLKCRTDVPMTVTKLPICNTAAGHEPKAVTTWLHTDGSVKNHEFKAVELSL